MSNQISAPFDVDKAIKDILGEMKADTGNWKAQTVFNAAYTDPIGKKHKQTCYGKDLWLESTAQWTGIDEAAIKKHTQWKICAANEADLLEYMVQVASDVAAQHKLGQQGSARKIQDLQNKVTEKERIIQMQVLHKRAAQRKLGMLKGAPKRVRRPNASAPKTQTTQWATARGEIKDIIKKIYTDADAQNSAISNWEVVAAAYVHTNAKWSTFFIGTVIEGLKNDSKLHNDDGWTEWLAGLADIILLQEPRTTKIIVTDNSQDLDDWKSVQANIPDNVMDPVWDLFSAEAVKEAETETKKLDAKRDFSGYLKDSYNTWYGWALDGWSGGIMSKMWVAAKIPLSIVGFATSLILDPIAKITTGKTINRRFSENQALDLTVTSSSDNSPSTST